MFGNKKLIISLKEKIKELEKQNKCLEEQINSFIEREENLKEAEEQLIARKEHFEKYRYKEFYKFIKGIFNEGYCDYF